MGTALIGASQYQRSLGSFAVASRIFRRYNDRSGEGYAWNGLAEAYYQLGRHERAIAASRQSLAVFQSAGILSGQGYALNSLGLAFTGDSRYRESVVCF